MRSVPRIFFVLAFCAVTLLSGCSRTVLGDYDYGRTSIRLKLPGAMKPAAPLNGIEGKIFQDSLRHAMLVITAQNSRFKSVDEYLNCSWQNLDDRLKRLSEDSTFRLIDCQKKKDATILTYSAAPSVNYFPYCILYFEHRGTCEYQYSFYFQDSTIAANSKYAAKVMRTVRYR